MTTSELNFSQIEGTQNGATHRLSYCGEYDETELRYFSSYLTSLSSNSPTMKLFKLNPSGLLRMKCMTLAHSANLATIYSGLAVETETNVWTFAML